MKKIHRYHANSVNHVTYKWYQRWWFIILVTLTIPYNYGFSILLAGLLIYSRRQERKLKQ